MSFPRIKHCIVCEDARRERGNKTSILGFYGLTPDVEIAVADITKPVDRVMFFLIAEGAGGPASHQASIDILDDQQKVLAQVAGMKFELPAETEMTVNSIFGIGFGSVTFARPGTFTFKLTVDGREHYRTTFRTAVATPAQLAM